MNSRQKNPKEAFLLTCIEEFKRINIAQTMALETFVAALNGKIENKSLINLTLDSIMKSSKLMDSVLYIASPNFTRAKPILSRFNVNNLINNSLSELSAIINFNNLGILKNYTEDDDLIANEEKIKKVIDSILLISFDKAKSDSKINIKTHQKDDYFMFEVQVESNSIEFENLKQILAKNDTTKSFSLEDFSFLFGVNMLIIKEMLIAHKAKFIFRTVENDTKILGFAILANQFK